MNSNEPGMCIRCSGSGVEPETPLDQTQTGRPCKSCSGAGVSTPNELAKAWQDGHIAGYWNGRESMGDTTGKITGQDHADATNPHAGGTGFTPDKLLARALTHEHTGKTVTVKGSGATVTGVLVCVSHKRGMIDERRMFPAPGEAQYVPGQARTVVTLIPDLELILNPDSEVEVTL